MRKLIFFILIVYFEQNITTVFLKDTRHLDVDNFTISQMQDIKYRCIRYFEDSRKNMTAINTYHETKCADYKYDYLNFVLYRRKVHFDNLMMKMFLVAMTYTIMMFI